MSKPRRRRVQCGHRKHYLTYAMSKGKVVRRALACRFCNHMILLPTYVVILNDMNAEKVEISHE